MSNKENLASHFWRDGGEQIEVTPILVVASSGRAEEFGLKKAIGLNETPNLPFPSSYRVTGPHTFLQVDAEQRAKCKFGTLLLRVSHLLMTFLSGAAEGVQLVVSDSLKTMLSH
ncbi:hypothetical protein [Pseudomonas putida]|uniref:hypothetical protein n=1 Tax=Pseudomonas putida TaxID=303 RepID=UPI0022DE67ED|nr:hypothetical protein [Pseudomonas putida]WBM49628.1 hypothetical protein M2J85_19405 [Pseudomonas putida]